AAKDLIASTAEALSRQTTERSFAALRTTESERPVLPDGERDARGPEANESDRVAAAEFQDLALERIVLARQSGKDLAAEGIDVGADVVGECRPEFVVDNVHTDEPARDAAAGGSRLGLRRGRPLEQLLEHAQALLVDRRHDPAGAHRLGGGLRRQPE